MSRTRYYSERCFICGRSNHKGLHADIISDGASVVITAAPATQFQGFDGVVHGGIISALLDETLWYAVYVAGHVTVTVQLQLTIRRAASPGEALRASAKFTGRDRRYLLAEGTVHNAAGELLAEAKGRFLPAPHLEAHLGELIISESLD